MGRHADSKAGREDDWEVGDPDATDADTWVGVTREHLPVEEAPTDG